MKSAQQPEPSGKLTAILASMIGLALVWSVVWANLPSREELLSEQPALGPPAPPPVPELDLTIPGVSSMTPVREPGRAGGSAASNGAGRIVVPHNALAKDTAKARCDVEVQHVCPGLSAEGERWQCMTRRLQRLSVPCRRIIREQMVERK